MGIENQMRIESQRKGQRRLRNQTGIENQNKLDTKGVILDRRWVIASHLIRLAIHS